MCLQRPPEPHAGIEPAFLAWKASTLAIVLVRRGDSGWDRTSGLLGFNQALVPTELQSHQSVSRDGRTRTCDFLTPNQAPYQAGLHPVGVGIAGLEPATSRPRTARSTKLSHIPNAGLGPPWTARESNPESSCLQDRRSTNWS